MAILDEVKESLRISSEDFDTEVNNLIEACESDLETSGIAFSVPKEGEEEQLQPLVKNAIINYCKAEFGFDNTESEKYREAYESMKKKLAIVFSKE